MVAQSNHPPTKTRAYAGFRGWSTVALWQIATTLKKECVARFQERRVVVVVGQSNHPQERAYMHVFVGGGGGGD